MRHFSGEFEGIRLLMSDELEQIAGGEGEDTDDLIPFNECQDRRSDNIAQSLGNAFGFKPDVGTNEYGALIYRAADGTLYSTALVAGDNGQVVFSGVNQQYGFDWSDVVGVMHSHPTTVYQDGQTIQITPDMGYDMPSGADWRMMDFIASQSGTDVNNLRSYIYFNGQISEYYYTGNDNTGLGNEERWRNSVKSTSYDPNGQCPGS